MKTSTIRLPVVRVVAPGRMVNERVSFKLPIEALRTLIVYAAQVEAEERVRVKMLFQGAASSILGQVDA